MAGLLVSSKHGASAPRERQRPHPPPDPTLDLRPGPARGPAAAKGEPASPPRGRDPRLFGALVLALALDGAALVSATEQSPLTPADALLAGAALLSGLTLLGLSRLWR
jgi:hypothetical protein